MMLINEKVKMEKMVMKKEEKEFEEKRQPYRKKWTEDFKAWIKKDFGINLLNEKLPNETIALMGTAYFRGREDEYRKDQEEIERLKKKNESLWDRICELYPSATIDESEEEEGEEP